MLRALVLLALALALSAGAVVLAPPAWWPESWQQAVSSQMAPAYSPPAASLPPVELAAEAICSEPFPDWREAQTVDGVAIEASPRCNPDNPSEIAAFVKGTNRVSADVLMRSRLAPDAVVKGADLDGDGDPDEIHLRLEVAELNGATPDGPGPALDYAIAPGIRPGFWVFAPKSRGMASETFEDTAAHRSLRVPSPVIRVEQGDTVKITLENTHTMPHTIHFHGVDHPFVDANGEGNDGVPQTSEMPVMPGESRTYELTPRQAGTMFYHCHVQPAVHILMGLQAMFVVEENRPNNPVQTFNVGAGQVRVRSQASHEAYDREYDLHYQEVDREMHDLVRLSNDPRRVIEEIHRGYDITERTPDYFLLNGRSFPYTARESLVVVAPDERVRLRVVNGGAEGVALHTHGHKVTITHTDGVPVPPAAQLIRDVIWVAPAQRADLLLETVDDGLHSYGQGIWLMHDHHEPAVTNDGVGPGGSVGAIVYESYLGDGGIPRLQGVDWTPYFSPAFYAGRVPVWQTYDPLGMLGDVAPESWPTLRPILFGGDIGLLLAVLFAVVRRRRT
jgi:manganese oxidase